MEVCLRFGVERRVPVPSLFELRGLPVDTQGLLARLNLELDRSSPNLIVRSNSEWGFI
jgi:hypothetical protein